MNGYYKSYLTWISEERALLWIKGKPGAGKSTLLSFIYRVYQQRAISKRGINLDFFFHGRGTLLQKTSEDMFRSLLHQLFTQCHSVRSSIRTVFKEKRSFGEAEKDWQWQSRELEELLFNGVIHAAKRHAITIFVDALDEAGADVACELTSYLHRLNDDLAVQKRSGRICISCRHYPVISRSRSLEVCVEDENRRDISTYVRNKLSSESVEKGSRSDPTYDLRALAEDVIIKASGVFQWVKLVVPMMIKLSWEGESLSYIKERLAEVPEDL